MEPEIKSLNFIFPTKYVVPKSLKFSDWLSKEVKIQTKTWNHHLSWCLKGFRQRLFHVPYVPVMPKMFFFATLGPLRLCSLSGFGPQRISIYIICIKQERCRFRNDNFGCPECFQDSFFFLWWSYNYCINFVWHPPLNVACHWPSNSSWGHVSTAWKTLGAWWCRVLLSCRHKTCCLIVNVYPANCQWLQRLVCAWPSASFPGPRNPMPEKPPEKTHTLFSNQTPYLLPVTIFMETMQCCVIHRCETGNQNQPQPRWKPSKAGFFGTIVVAATT